LRLSGWRCCNRRVQGGGFDSRRLHQCKFFKLNDLCVDAEYVSASSCVSPGPLPLVCVALGRYSPPYATRHFGDLGTAAGPRLHPFRAEPCSRSPHAREGQWPSHRPRPSRLRPRRAPSQARCHARVHRRPPGPRCGYHELDRPRGDAEARIARSRSLGVLWRATRDSTCRDSRRTRGSSWGSTSPLPTARPRSTSLAFPPRSPQASVLTPACT